MKNAGKLGLMKEAALLALPEGMDIDQIHITQTGLVVEVASTTPSSRCPLCLEPSSHIHSYYHRTLKDAPCVGHQLQLSLTVRKFLCQNPDCSRKVFTERIPDLAEPWARMTTRLKEQITSIGLSTSGKAQYCELKQHWKPPLAQEEASQPFEQNPQSIALAKRTREVADCAFWVYADCRPA